MPPGWFRARHRDMAVASRDRTAKLTAALCGVELASTDGPVTPHHHCAETHGDHTLSYHRHLKYGSLYTSTLR